MRKTKPAGNAVATRRSRRVELLNPERKKLDADSIKNLKEVKIFAGGGYHFEDDEEDEEQAEEEVSTEGCSKIEQ